jgi:hypothetical protein
MRSSQIGEAGEAGGAGGEAGEELLDLRWRLAILTDFFYPDDCCRHYIRSHFLKTPTVARPGGHFVAALTSSAD